MAPCCPGKEPSSDFSRLLTAGKWGLFHLDAPAGYEGTSYDYFLIRSRWAGYEIGGAKATSVFILLVDDVAKVQDGFDVKGFEHVAWGMVGGG